MEERSQINADECLARAVYTTGSPAHRQCILEEISECPSPSVHPSNQTCFIYSLAGCRVQVKVKQIIEKADCIAIISDGWSNVRGQGIINYIIANPQPVFYKSTDTRDNRHTGLFIADELKVVINDLGPQKVFALVTNNAANMKAAWSKVEES